MCVVWFEQNIKKTNFSCLTIKANMDYIFWKKNNIMKPEDMIKIFILE